MYWWLHNTSTLRLQNNSATSHKLYFFLLLKALWFMLLIIIDQDHGRDWIGSWLSATRCIEGQIKTLSNYKFFSFSGVLLGSTFVISAPGMYIQSTKLVTEILWGWSGEKKIGRNFFTLLQSSTRVLFKNIFLKQNVFTKNINGKIFYHVYYNITNS